jgi:plasmid stabilization system protein ParE
MNFRSEFLPEAVGDIREARIWYEDKSPSLGMKFIESVNRCLDQIEARPITFPVFSKSIRRAVLDRFPYCVYFVVQGETVVVIVAVVHGRRDPQVWQTRMIH